MANGQHVVYRQYAGPMASDREPLVVVFGPETRERCETWVGQTTKYDGMYTTNRYVVAPTR